MICFFLSYYTCTLIFALQVLDSFGTYNLPPASLGAFLRGCDDRSATEILWFSVPAIYRAAASGTLCQDWLGRWPGCFFFFWRGGVGGGFWLKLPPQKTKPRVLLDVRDAWKLGFHWQVEGLMISCPTVGVFVGYFLVMFAHRFDGQ